ncbi:MAG: hypothetical protein RLZZ262_22 [Bacteroidota bacterium]
MENTAFTFFTVKLTFTRTWLLLLVLVLVLLLVLLLMLLVLLVAPMFFSNMVVQGTLVFINFVTRGALKSRLTRVCLMLLQHVTLEVVGTSKYFVTKIAVILSHLLGKMSKRINFNSTILDA